ERLVQAGRGRCRKTLIERLWADLDAQSGRCLGEFFQGRLGIAEKPKHQGLAERGTIQRGGALDKARGPPRRPASAAGVVKISRMARATCGMVVIGKLLACRHYGVCRNPIMP